MPANRIQLYSWGPIAFELYPLNIGEVDHTTGTEWARKEIAGAAIYREWVGESEETLHVRGKVFPKFFARATSITRNNVAVAAPERGMAPGGLGHLDVMDNMRRLGQAHSLDRGDGWHLGWFVIERFARGHTFLSPNGVGQQIAFEATFQRVPVPSDPAAYYQQLWASQR